MNNQKGLPWKLAAASYLGTNFHCADFWYVSTSMSGFMSLFVIAPRHWHIGATQLFTSVFQQILSCWYRNFPHSEAEKSCDGCKKFLKTSRHGKDVGWDEEDTFVETSPLAAFASRSLCSLAQGSSLLLLWKLMSYSREQMHCTDLCSRALHAAHMPGKGASTLQQLPCAGKPSSASTECGRMVKAIVIIIKGILYMSIWGLVCPDFRQDPGKICQ